MKIHEYQAKELFRQNGITVPDGTVIENLADIEAVADGAKSFPVVVKAQIHAGGRGKGGGVKLAKSAAEIKELAGEIMGMNLITHQTGSSGKIVKKLLIEQGVAIEHEFYLSLVPDRNSAGIIIMASREGGMDIEEVAANTPEKIVKVNINPLLGIQSHHCRAVGFGLGLPGAAMKQLNGFLASLYKLFVNKDCSLIEINPLVLTEDQQLVAIDAKVNFDDNALFRHKDIAQLHDPDEDDPQEAEASGYGLNYINLEGNVGNMVNGAGLAMATMDIIKLAGAEPANFLDVGGGASAEMVENGFRIILQDENVKAVLVNIFGGILRCDVLAEGIVQAAKNTSINVPVVVRMEGTNVEEGRKILSESGLDLITAADLKDAASRIGAIAGGQS